MLTGEVFDAATAAAGGLIDVVAADDDLDAVLAGQLTALAAGAPVALAETKRMLRAAQPELRFDELLRLSARFFASEEGQEGIASFREKRPARWVPTED
jgi:methylglutaconyl-CoA hydratase